MLEGVPVIGDVVVVVVGIGKEIVTPGKYISCTHIRRGKEHPAGVFYLIYFARIVSEGLTQFIT
jgi:hypothetical protein